MTTIGDLKTSFAFAEVLEHLGEGTRVYVECAPGTRPVPVLHSRSEKINGEWSFVISSQEHTDDE